jgi:hypothetical protein
MGYRFLKEQMTNPAFMDKFVEYGTSNPAARRVIVGSTAGMLGAAGIGFASRMSPENEALEKAAQAANWVGEPVFNTAAEFLGNRAIGLSGRHSAALAGGSGIGVITGKMLGANLFKDEEGRSNQLAISGGGLAGDVLGDVVSEQIINRSPMLQRVLNVDGAGATNMAQGAKNLGGIGDAAKGLQSAVLGGGRDAVRIAKSTAAAGGKKGLLAKGLLAAGSGAKFAGAATMSAGLPGLIVGGTAAGILGMLALGQRREKERQLQMIAPDLGMY